MRGVRLCLLLLAGLLAPAVAAQEVCTPSASGVWKNLPFAAQRDSFVVEYDDTPNALGIDGHTGLAARLVGAATPTLSYAQLAVITRFKTTGIIDAYNGTAYAATTAFAYTAGVRYHFRVIVRVPTHRYTAYVKSGNGPEVVLAQDFRFRSTQDTVQALSYWVVYASTPASHTVCNWQLTGLAAPPPARAEYYPQPLDFGPVRLGQSSDVLRSTLTNTGSTPFSSCGPDPMPSGCLAHSSMTGAPPFSYITDNCLTLASGASCVLQYRFTPTRVGVATGTNIVQTTGGPFPLNLVGTGVDTTTSPPPASGGVARLRPSPLAFSLIAGSETPVEAVPLDSAGRALGAEVTWASSDSAVLRIRQPYATVTQGVVAYALTAGTATVTASAGGQRTAMAVTVLPGPDTTPVLYRVVGGRLSNLPSQRPFSFPAVLPLYSGRYTLLLFSERGDTVRASVTVPGPQ